MDTKSLLQMMNEFDRLGHWCFTIANIRMYFCEESKHTTLISLSRHVKRGILVRITKGLYANPRSTCRPLHALESIARHLRDVGTFYLSLEKAASEYSLISQVPNRLTFVSAKKSRILYTPYGIIEFTKVKDSDSLMRDCVFDRSRQIWIASEKKVIDDLYKYNRAVDLYEEEQEKEKQWG